MRFSLLPISIIRMYIMLIYNSQQDYYWKYLLNHDLCNSWVWYFKIFLRLKLRVLFIWIWIDASNIAYRYYFMFLLWNIGHLHEFLKLKMSDCVTMSVILFKYVDIKIVSVCLKVQLNNKHTMLYSSLDSWNRGSVWQFCLFS